MYRSVAIVTTLVVTLVAVAWSAGDVSQVSSKPQASGSSKTAVARPELGLSAGEVDAITVPHLLSYQGKLLVTTGNLAPDTIY